MLEILCVRGSIWQKRLSDGNVAEFNLVDGCPHLTVRIPGQIIPWTTYKVSKEQGLELLKHVSSMTVHDVRQELVAVGHQLMEVLV